MGDIDAIRVKAYWTPGQCARMYAHGEVYFKRLLDSGKVAGYTRLTPKGTRRYLNADSVRAHFALLEQVRIDEAARYEHAISHPPRVSMRELVGRDPVIQALRAARAG